MDWVHISMCKKRPVQESSGASLVKRPHLESRIETHPDGKKSAGGSESVPVLLLLGRRGGMRGSESPDMSTVHSLHIIPVFSSAGWVCFPIFWFNGEALLLTGLCLIWYTQGHTLPCSVISGCSM